MLKTKRGLYLFIGVSATAAVLSIILAPRASASVTLPNLNGLNPVAPTSNKQAAANLISRYNNAQFGGWFNQGGRSEKDVLAIFKIESNYEAGAINRNDGFGGAWGIGQVLADVAAIDYGVAPPERLLELDTGVLTSMRHMRSQWDDLARRLGRNPTKGEWVRAYNAGARGVAELGRGFGYLTKFTAARAVI